MTITEFLRPRIVEDEEAARGVDADAWSFDVTADRRFEAYGDHVEIGVGRTLAECEAKRRIVELHQRCNVHDRPGDECDACQRCGDGSIWPCDTLLAVASVYADHPDFREEWRLTS